VHFNSRNSWIEEKELLHKVLFGQPYNQLKIQSRNFFKVNILHEIENSLPRQVIESVIGTSKSYKLFWKLEFKKHGDKSIATLFTCNFFTITKSAVSNQSSLLYWCG
jgi:hypothetical protein